MSKSSPSVDGSATLALSAGVVFSSIATWKEVWVSDIIRILIVAIAGGGIAAGIGVMVQRRRARRLQRVDRLECSVRVVTGTHDGLSEKWWAGEATLSYGRVHFVPFVGAVRFLRRKAVEIVVDKIDVSERRSPKGREVLSVDPGTDVVRLVTPTATLEWAVPERQMTWALDRLSLTAD